MPCVSITGAKVAKSSVRWLHLQDNPELDAIWRLLQYFWNKHYQGIWQALQGYQWSQQVRGGHRV
jgi:hypothetical protein